MEIFRAWGLRRQVRAGDLRVRPLCSVSPTLRTALAAGLPLGFPTDPRAVLAVSPVLPACFPQDHIEPVLLDHLRPLGGEVRFGVELIDLTDRGTGFTPTSATAPPAPRPCGPGSLSAPTAPAATSGARGSGDPLGTPASSST